MKKADLPTRRDWALGGAVFGLGALATQPAEAKCGIRSTSLKLAGAVLVPGGFFVAVAGTGSTAITLGASAGISVPITIGGIALVAVGKRVFERGVKMCTLEELDAAQRGMDQFTVD
jgi:hypothetical protein